MDLTHQDTLGKWLLRVLLANGGSATKADALKLMEARFGHLLTQDDLLLEPKVKELKWQNRTAFERDKLVKSGLLQPLSQAGHGQWTLTDEGLRIAERTELIASRRET